MADWYRGNWGFGQPAEQPSRPPDGGLATNGEAGIGGNGGNRKAGGWGSAGLLGSATAGGQSRLCVDRLVPPRRCIRENEPGLEFARGTFVVGTHGTDRCTGVRATPEAGRASM